MKSLNNVGAERLGDALGESIDDGAKLSIISSYFTVFAYGELKEELSKIDEVRFLFSEPTFIKRMADSKEPREFEVARRAREVGVGGSGLELTLRNNLNQRALARGNTPSGSAGGASSSPPRCRRHPARAARTSWRTPQATTTPSQAPPRTSRKEGLGCESAAREP